MHLRIVESGTLEEDLRQLPLNYQDCRDNTHSCFTWQVDWLSNGGASEIRKCRSCESTKPRDLDRWGWVMWEGNIEYPKATEDHPAFLLKGHGRLTGTDRDFMRMVRMETMRQAEISRVAGPGIEEGAPPQDAVRTKPQDAPAPKDRKQAK
jgi:hypothetical protein